jgi:hypothetical protein
MTLLLHVIENISPARPHTNTHTQREMYQWQSEHECDTCMIVLRHILAVLCEMFSITRVMTDG